MGGEAATDFVRSLVYERAAIVLGADKDYLVESRLVPVARSRGLESLDALAAELRKPGQHELIEEVVEALTTNETYFFRDQHPFEVLRRSVLPRLIEARAATRRLRFWCGAASTGQEPYSVVMTLLDVLPDVSQWNIEFIASDINHTVLDRARAGAYRQHEVERGLPAALLHRHFDRVGSQWVIKQRLRDLVDYRVVNLAEAWPLHGAFDVIFMRNVLIYFDVETKKRILNRSRRLLSPDGVLFLGGAETVVNLDDEYQHVREGRSVFYRKAG